MPFFLGEVRDFSIFVVGTDGQYVFKDKMSHGALSLPGYAVPLPEGFRYKNWKGNV